MERLWFWGGEVEVGVPKGKSASEWQPITLDNLAPHYWRRPFMK